MTLMYLMSDAPVSPISYYLSVGVFLGVPIALGVIVTGCLAYRICKCLWEE